MLKPFSGEKILRPVEMVPKNGCFGGKMEVETLDFGFATPKRHFLTPLQHSRTTVRACDQKGKTNVDFTEARDSEWQWHQLGHMQVCTSLQTNNHAAPNH